MARVLLFGIGAVVGLIVGLVTGYLIGSAPIEWEPKHEEIEPDFNVWIFQDDP